MSRLRRRDAANQGGQVLYEALVNAAFGHALGAVRVDDFAGDLGLPELGYGLRHSVHVDHELVTVPRAFLAGLHVCDEDVVLVEHQQVGLPASLAEWPRWIQWSRCSLSSLVWQVSHSAWLKSQDGLPQF